MSPHQPDPAPGAEPERGFLVAVLPQGADAEEELGELRELLRTAGVLPVGELVQRRPSPDARTYVGKGKLLELKAAVAEAEAESVVIDDDLDPGQQRRLEDEFKLRVVDRTQLILDIFAQHAVTAEGKLQVELAQLEYNLPRMRGLWQHLERLGGGIGTRGPGESQLETDRRLARRRIGVLRERLRRLGRGRETQRKHRQSGETPVVSLAGYTNAGKSTLLNALTGADVSVNDRLFETLDPTTRGFEHEGRRYLVTDTVGFIRRLPHQLVQGFAATLEETLFSDLILHVADASRTDESLDELVVAVDSVLREIGASELPVEVRVEQDRPASTRFAAAGLRTAFPARSRSRPRRAKDSPSSKRALRSGSRPASSACECSFPTERETCWPSSTRLGAPIEERVDRPDGVLVVARLPRGEAARFAPYLVVESPARATQR